MKTKFLISLVLLIGLSLSTFAINQPEATSNSPGIELSTLSVDAVDQTALNVCIINQSVLSVETGDQHTLIIVSRAEELSTNIADETIISISNNKGDTYFYTDQLLGNKFIERPDRITINTATYIVNNRRYRRQVGPLSVYFSRRYIPALVNRGFISFTNLKS